MCVIKGGGRGVCRMITLNHKGRRGVQMEHKMDSAIFEQTLTKGPFNADDKEQYTTSNVPE